MTEKELKRMNRKQLLELLLIQTQEINKLNSQINELEETLANKEIIAAEAGNIAEAALRLNGIFEAAQAAADQYLGNVRSLSSGKRTVGSAVSPFSATKKNYPSSSKGKKKHLKR